jgi:hypothetical protein
VTLDLGGFVLSFSFNFLFVFYLSYDFLFIWTESDGNNARRQGFSCLLHNVLFISCGFLSYSFVSFLYLQRNRVTNLTTGGIMINLYVAKFHGLQSDGQ